MIHRASSRKTVSSRRPSETPRSGRRLGGWRYVIPRSQARGDGCRGSNGARARLGKMALTTADGATASGGEPRRANASGRATRELLICTAERLFADRGIDAVSLREIGQAAGQRNNAVMQYHFGSRAALLQAIFAYRSAAIDARRFELLACLEAERRLDDAHALLGAVLTPHVESVDDPDNHFVGFLARILTDQATMSTIDARAAAPNMGGYRALQAQVRACVPTLPAADFDRRFTMVFNWAIHSLAEYARTSRSARSLPLEAMFEELVAMLVDALRAPPQRRERAARARSRRSG